MKSQNLYGINILKFEEVNTPKFMENEAIVQVKAAGICGSDIPRIYKTGAHRHPLIPGHEFSGKVVEVGAEVDSKWVGKRVGIFPLIPCKECGPCLDHNYEMCRNYDYLGSRRDGGFAEYVVVPEWNLIELPDSVTYEQAAMLEPMAVAAHAFRVALGDKSASDFAKNINIAVCGLGTIGLLITMLLKQAGFNNILLIGNKEAQMKAAEKLGISNDNYCDSKQINVSEWIFTQTNQNGVDVFFECVGKNETIAQAIDLCAPAGKVTLVGNPYSDIDLDKQIYWKILRNQLSVKGIWNSSYTHEKDDDWHYVLHLLENQSIHPEVFISHRYELENLHKGLEIMRDKTEDYIKVMCVYK